MWRDQTLKDAWSNLDEVAHRLRRGNTHYHNTIELLNTVQDLLQHIDYIQSRMDRVEDELRQSKK